MRQPTIHPSEAIPSELKQDNVPEATKGEDKDTNAVQAQSKKVEVEATKGEDKDTNAVQAQSKKVEVLNIDTEESETEGIPEKHADEVEPKDGKEEEQRSKRSVSQKSKASKESNASELSERSPDHKADYSTSSEEIEDTSKNGPEDAGEKSERRSNYKPDIRSAAQTGNLGRSFARSSLLSTGRRTSGTRTTKNDTFQYRSKVGGGHSSRKSRKSRHRRSRTTKNTRNDWHRRNSTRDFATGMFMFMI